MRVSPCILIGIITIAGVLLSLSLLLVFSESSAPLELSGPPDPSNPESFPLATGIRLGNASIKEPDRCDLINTSSWGEVPSDMVVVVMKDGTTQEDRENLARSLGGKIVGFFDYINLYQIEYHTVCGGHNETLLIKQMQTAQKSEKVELAYPNSQPLFDGRTATEVSALSNAIYTDDDRDAGYNLIQVKAAWDIVRVSHLPLSPVRVSVIDDGVYTGFHTLDFGPVLDTTANGSKLSRPLSGWDHVGSHGTGIMNIIGADTKGNGISGIASEPLAGKLTLAMRNNQIPPYGSTVEVSKESDKDTVAAVVDAKTYSVGNFGAIKDEIEKGATIISISWGNSNAHPQEAAAYRKFFEKIAKEYPYVLFVCSAGNDNSALDGSRRYPSGLALPNMITVGNIRNDGSNRARSSMRSDNYEVTLAAPGQQAVYGVDTWGTIVHTNGGSSMATPHVTATAAIIRALDPSLSAGNLKEIIVNSARSEVSIDGRNVKAPEELGGRILSVDLAVLAAVNSLRSEQGLPPYSPEQILRSTTIRMTAERDPGVPGDWIIHAEFPDGVAATTEVFMMLEEGDTITSAHHESLSSLPSRIEWRVHPETSSAIVSATRKDSDSTWKVVLS